MSIQLPCVCGNRISVEEVQAGLRVVCACGGEIDVPSLGALRRMVGAQSPVSALLVVESLLAKGELPSTDECAGCGADTPRIVDVWLCEQVIENSSSRGASQIVAFLLFGWLGMLAVLWTKKHRAFTDAREIRLPLRLCANCHRSHIDALPHWPFIVLAAGVVAVGVAATWIMDDLAPAVLSVPASCLILAGAGAWSSRRQRQVFHKLLRSEPAYRRILTQFPEAQLQVADRESAIGS